MRPGEQIGDYTIVSKLGEGGMSIVYLAEHTTAGPRVGLEFRIFSLNPRLRQRCVAPDV